MDPVENPYTPGAGTPPPVLTGREPELREFEIVLKRFAAGRYSRSILITGLRGVGKTVLLNEFSKRATDEGWFVASSEVRTTGGLANLVAYLARGALLEMSRMERLKERAMKALGVLKAFVVSVGDIDLRIDVDALAGYADSGDLERDLGDVIVELGRVAEDAGTGVVLLLDEVQLLGRQELEALMAALHRTAQENLPIFLVGVGLPLLPKLTGEAKSYAERLFEFRSLGSLDKEAAFEALALPAEAQGVSYQGEALAKLFTYAEGYPYFLQEYGKHVWNVADQSPIVLSDVYEAHDAVLVELDRGFFHVRVERTPVGERHYMSAMAYLGDGPQRSSDVARRLGYPTVSGSSLVRDNLLKKGLIYSPRHGYVDFTVPLFADYVRRKFPFDPSTVTANRRRRRAGGRSFGSDVYDVVGEVLGQIVEVLIDTSDYGIAEQEDDEESLDEEETLDSYFAVEISASSDSPEEILAYLEVLVARQVGQALDGGSWRRVLNRIGQSPEKFAIVVSESPVKVGADSHLAPRVLLTTTGSSYLEIDEIQIYIVDLSGNVTPEEQRSLFQAVRDDIFDRATAEAA